MRLPAALVLLMVVGCADRPLAPERVPVDEATCARCGMVISSEPDSAEWVAAGEETRFYDDIGCLATDDRLPAGRNTRFVHVGGRWISADDASFARPADASTPMGYGVVAFEHPGKAALRDRGGRARNWDELVSEIRAERKR